MEKFLGLAVASADQARLPTLVCDNSIIPLANSLLVTESTRALPDVADRGQSIVSPHQVRELFQEAPRRMILPT